MERLAKAKAGSRSLTEAIETTTPGGRMMMQMVGASAEFERAMLSERTKAGLQAARQEGRIGGRPPKLAFRFVTSGMGGETVAGWTLNSRAGWAAVLRPLETIRRI